MKTPIIILFTLLSTIIYGQNISINNTGGSANTSAILDLQSTIGGFLLPRMTSAERDLIATPATSLLIFNTSNARFEYYNGAAWQAQNAGAMILLSNSEVDVTGIATMASVKSFAVPANIYSQIMVETEVGLEQSGSNDAEWNFSVLYAGVAKESHNIRLRGNNASQSHKTLSTIKYSEAMPLGGTVQVNATAVTVNGLWKINALRVYGII